MHGTILIVDPIATNRIVLKVKLSTACYDVTQAATIADTVREVTLSKPDVIITASQLPDGAAGDLTKALRAAPNSADIPVIAIDNGATQETRLKLLAEGVDDVLASPVNETLMLARIRSLVRAFSSSAEWQLRDDTTRALGLTQQGMAEPTASTALLVSNNNFKTQRWITQLRPLIPTELSKSCPQKALSPFGQFIGHANPDVFVLIIDDEDPDEMLRLLACIRAHQRTRHCGVMVLLTTPNAALAAQALDLGANDLMFHGFNAGEMSLRLSSLIRHKQISEQLRATVRTGLEAAICDPLTGLHNRRYAMPHLDRIAENAQQSGKPFAVMVADMDYFKQINDLHGHAAGDAVLVETARRLRENLRAIDLIARIGGEEFLIVMPGMSLGQARATAQNLRQVISDTPYQIPGKDITLTATISIGLALGGPAAPATGADTSPSHVLLDQADQALYCAKNQGRNQVTLSRPAA